MSSGTSGTGGGYVDATAGAVEHCEAMAMEFPDLAEAYYSVMKSHVQQKLWHQLTIKVMEFVQDPNAIRSTASSGDVHSYLALYDKVVLAVDSKLNPLSLAQIASAVATALVHQDRTAAKALLENLLASKKHAEDPLIVPATIFLQSKHSVLALQPLLNDPAAAQQDEEQKKVLASIKSHISQNASKLQELSAGDHSSHMGIVHAAHYEQAMIYYKVVGPPEAFYEQAMSFLNYAPMPTGGEKSTTTIDYPQLAIDLCLAALTGDGVYNLGQVQQTPILGLLKDTPNAWLVDLLQACGNGKVTEFRQFTETHAASIQQQPALVARATAVQEKLTLLALVHLVFEKPSQERTLTFEEIATRLQLSDKDQVEWIIMRALSVGLMEGMMDQVDQEVQVTWVMPRVLSKEQMKDLAQRFGSWAVKVEKAKDYMQEQTPTFA